MLVVCGKHRDLGKCSVIYRGEGDLPHRNRLSFFGLMFTVQKHPDARHHLTVLSVSAGSSVFPNISLRWVAHCGWSHQSVNVSTDTSMTRIPGIRLASKRRHPPHTTRCLSCWDLHPPGERRAEIVGRTKKTPIWSDQLSRGILAQARAEER